MNSKRPNTLNDINKQICRKRTSLISNTDSDVTVTTYDNIDNLQKRLYDEVLSSMKESAEMDIQESEMKRKFKVEISKSTLELEKWENKLVAAMQEYVKSEDEIWELENQDRSVHSQVHELMQEYEIIQQEIDKENNWRKDIETRNRGINQEIRSQEIECQKVWTEYKLKNQILRQKREEIQKEFDYTLDMQANIQLLSGKPFITAVLTENNIEELKSSGNLRRVII